MPSTVSGSVAGDRGQDQSFQRQPGAPKIENAIKNQPQDELKHSLSPIDGQLLAPVFLHARGSKHDVHQLSLETNMASCVSSFPQRKQQNNAVCKQQQQQQNVFEASIYKRTDVKVFEAPLHFCQVAEQGVLSTEVSGCFPWLHGEAERWLQTC